MRHRDTADYQFQAVKKLKQKRTFLGGVAQAGAGWQGSKNDG